MTYTSYPGGNAVTVTTAPHEVTWSVSSTNTTREEIAPDVILERTSYQASRQGTLRALGQEIPVTERIEVKHVRYLNLVPRG
jgi:hypothetical protein